MLEARTAIGSQPIRRAGTTLRELAGRTILAIASAEPAASWPPPGRSVPVAGGRLLRLAPDQCLWLGDAPPARLPEGLVTDQSDAWAVVELDGPAALAAVERLCPLDLARWPVGAAGRTIVEHLPVIVIKTAADRFELLSPRSTARDFWHDLATALDAGLRQRPPARPRSDAGVRRESP